MSVYAPLIGKFFIAGWTIEPDLNLISDGDRSVHLEPKVMKVLVQLAASPGQVLSKERLIEAVWPDTFVTDDALTRCISVLRRELQDDPHSPRYIQTIPKAGYRLVAEVRHEVRHFDNGAEEVPAPALGLQEADGHALDTVAPPLAPPGSKISPEKPTAGTGRSLSWRLGIGLAVAAAIAV